MEVEQNMEAISKGMLSMGYVYEGLDDLTEAQKWVKEVKEEGKLSYTHTIYISDKLEQVEVEN